MACLNSAIAPALDIFRPPDDLTVSQWAERYRYLSRETSSEPGPWRNERTPYLVEPMDAFTDPKVSDIVLVAGSQVGKSELELNIIGYIIDQDPGSIIYSQPTVEDSRKFSRMRISPMIRDSKSLRYRVSDVRVKDSGNTILQKSFPGGMLTMTGSNSASALAATPARYGIGDELDRWASSAGTEGDPWELVEARLISFYNSKRVRVSTPTIRGRSRIEAAFYTGTQERWHHQCPHCRAWHSIVWSHIRFSHEIVEQQGRKRFLIRDVFWECPDCNALSTEFEMREQPARWIAEHPENIECGTRSFWLSAFASPWTSWDRIIRRVLEAGDDPLKLQPVKNTVLGELWEDRGGITDEETLLARREEYPAELPDSVLVLTCGVDTQGNRLEYEVVGFSRDGDEWGIRKGVIMGSPESSEVWNRLDDVIDHVYTYRNGRGLQIALTFVDSGGHNTQDVYRACSARFHKRVFAIRGGHGEGIPYVKPPSRVRIMDGDAVIGTCWLYTLGVDAGKAQIMKGLSVETPGSGYFHFPLDTDGMYRGYNYTYFHGLLSEKLTIIRTRTSERWGWVKLTGHERNEPLDIRNYARAAFRMMDPDMEAVERRLRDEPQIKPCNTAAREKAPHVRRSGQSRSPDEYYDD